MTIHVKLTTTDFADFTDINAKDISRGVFIIFVTMKKPAQIRRLKSNPQ